MCVAPSGQPYSMCVGSRSRNKNEGILILPSWDKGSQKIILNEYDLKEDPSESGLLIHTIRKTLVTSIIFEEPITLTRLSVSTKLF